MKGLRITIFILLFSLVPFGCGYFSTKTQDEQAEKSELKLEYVDAQDAFKNGEEFLARNDSRNAIKAFKKAIEFDVVMADAHFQLGIAYSLLEREQQTEIVTIDPDSQSEKKNSVRAFENSVKAYRKLTLVEPNNGALFFNLGRAHLKLFDDSQAERALQTAVELTDDNSEYRTELGAVLIKLAKYSAAISHLNKAIEINEENFRAEDLLVEAKAGRKRVGFKKTPKPKKSVEPQTTKPEKSDTPAPPEKSEPLPTETPSQKS